MSEQGRRVGRIEDVFHVPSLPPAEAVRRLRSVMTDDEREAWDDLLERSDATFQREQPEGRTDWLEPEDEAFVWALIIRCYRRLGWPVNPEMARLWERRT